MSKATEKHIEKFLLENEERFFNPAKRTLRLDLAFEEFSNTFPDVEINPFEFAFIERTMEARFMFKFQQGE